LLSTGTYPDRLKFSEIKPIYIYILKRWLKQITYYRPISLFPVVSKMFENIINRVSQEECARLWEGVPYVKVY